MEEKEKLFLEFIEGFEWKYDIEEYPNSLFVFKGDIYFFEIFNSEALNQKKIIANYRFGLEQDLKNYSFWFNYDKIWSVFESKFGMNYTEIQSFMNGMVEKHFLKRKGGTTKMCLYCHKIIVEKHFKMKGVTTEMERLGITEEVEKHFKLKKQNI